MFNIIETPERLYAIQENGKTIHDALTLYEAQAIVKVLYLHHFEVRGKSWPEAERRPDHRQEIA